MRLAPLLLALAACGGRTELDDGHLDAGPGACGVLGNECCETDAWLASGGEAGLVCDPGLQCMDLDQNDNQRRARCLYHCGELGEVCCNSDPTTGFECLSGFTCERLPSSEALEPYPGVYVADHCVENEGR